MSKAKCNNLKAMKSIAARKKEYGINQVGRTKFSSKSTLMNDSKAVNGKKVLQEKILYQI